MWYPLMALNVLHVLWPIALTALEVHKVFLGSFLIAPLNVLHVLWPIALTALEVHKECTASLNPNPEPRTPNP